MLTRRFRMKLEGNVESPRLQARGGLIWNNELGYYGTTRW